MEDEPMNRNSKEAGLIYQIIWYLMIAMLVLAVIVQHLGLGERTDNVATVISHLYLALVPLGLVLLTIVLFIKKSTLVATVAGSMVVIWLLLRFVIS